MSDAPRLRSAVRLPALDVLRFVAAVSVLLYHYVASYLPRTGLPPLLEEATEWTRYGYLGVELFFIISGFVILWSVQSRTATEFVVARASRLYPTFWVAVALASVVTIAAAERGLWEATRPSIGQIAANATMYPTLFGQPRIDDVYWTLELELRFYFLIFVLLVVKQIPAFERWVWCWLALCALNLFVPLPRLVAFLSLAPYGAFFIGGAVCYLGYDRGWSRNRVALFLLATSVAVVESIRVRGAFITPDAASAVVVPLIVSVLFVAVFAVSRWPTALGVRMAPLLGSLTYPLYLTHAAIGVVAIRALNPIFGPVQSLAVALTGAFVLAFTLAKLVDEPMRKPFANLLRSLLRSMSALTVRSMLQRR